MYKILYQIEKNNVNIEVQEYGFSRYILKRWIALEEAENIEVLWCLPLSHTWKNFLKCLRKDLTIDF